MRLGWAAYAIAFTVFQVVSIIGAQLLMSMLIHFVPALSSSARSCIMPQNLPQSCGAVNGGDLFTYCTMTV